MEDQEKLLDFFCQHLVSLAWYEGIPDQDGSPTGDPPFCMASGFVLEAAEEYWLVTAGHVFSGFDQRRAKKGVAAFLPRLVDLWGSNATTVVASPYPFPFFDDDVQRVVLDRDEDGLDFALVRIPHLVSKALSSTVMPFRRVDWLDHGDGPFDRIMMLGTPNELKSQFRWENRDSQFVRSRLWPIGLMLDELTREEAGIKKTKFPQFIGRISSEASISNIEGMSGGPILGIRFQPDGSVRYYPLAVQSRWIARKRIVIGTNVSVIGAMTEMYLLQQGSSDQ